MGWFSGSAVDSPAIVDLVHMTELLFSCRCALKRGMRSIQAVYGGNADISGRMTNGYVAGISC